MKYLLLIPVLLISFCIYFTTSESLIFKTLNWANAKYLTEYQLDLKNITFEWNNLSLTRKNIKLDSKKFCVFFLAHKNCFNQLTVDININLLSPMDFTVNKAIIKAQILELTLPKEEKNEPTDIQIGSYLRLVKNLLSEIKVDELELKLKEIFIISEQKTSKASFIVANQVSKHIINGNFSYSTPESLDYLGKVTINLKDMPQINIDSQLSLSNIEAKFTTKTIFGSDFFKLSIDSFDVKAMKNYSIKKGSCKTKFKYDDDFSLECQDLALQASIQKKFNFNLNSTLKIKNTINLNSTKEFVEGHFSGSAQKKSAYQLSLSSQFKLNGKSNGAEFNLEKLDLIIAVENFSELVTELRQTSFAIPAPFNNLEGDANLTAKLDTQLDFYHLPISGRFNLDKNKDIKVVGSLETQVTLRKDYTPKKISGEVTINNLKLYIPDIDPLFGIPEVSGTDRIGETIVFKPKTKSTMELDLVIKSKAIDSIKIYNQFFHPYLALSLNAKLTNEISTFDIKVKDGSSVQYLKRKLQVKKISLAKKEDTTLIDASFEYEASGYKIFLNIIGTAEKPVLLLSSFPSLPREEIISLLLYNRKSTELTGFDRASVGSTEDAISNRALGLFSIWAFASTPVDSVTYNSQTKTYNAVVSLPGGTSVSIGTDWDRLNNLSFRKRLNATWAVVTTFEPTDTDSKETIMLQKEISF